MSRMSDRLKEKILRCEHKIVYDLSRNEYIATNWNVMNLLYGDRKSVYEITYEGNVIMLPDCELYAVFDIIPDDADSFNVESDTVHVAVKVSKDKVIIKL